MQIKSCVAPHFQRTCFRKHSSSKETLWGNIYFFSITALMTSWIHLNVQFEVCNGYSSTIIIMPIRIPKITSEIYNTQYCHAVEGPCFVHYCLLVHAFIQEPLYHSSNDRRTIKFPCYLPCFSLNRENTYSYGLC